MGRIPVNQPYTITTEFGVPDSNAKFGKHSGIDFAGFGAGRPIYAPASGTLTNVDSPTGGKMVVIYDGKYYHRLMHNSSFSRNNGQVKEGDEVAKAGTTGLSTGVHCHWDINTYGTYPTAFNQFINPNQWLKEGGDMPATPDDIDRVFKLGGIQPTQADLSNPDYRDWKTLVYTVFNQAGTRPTGSGLAKGDIDNIFNDLGITPTQPDYDATKLSPKDFVYYLEGQVKARLPRGITRESALDYINKNLK